MKINKNLKLKKLTDYILCDVFLINLIFKDNVLPLNVIATNESQAYVSYSLMFNFEKDSGWVSLTFEDNLRNKYFIPSFLHLSSEEKKILENKKVIHSDGNIYFNMDLTIMGDFYRFYIDINNNSNNVKMSKSTLLKYHIFNKDSYYKSSIQMDNLIQYLFSKLLNIKFSDRI